MIDALVPGGGVACEHHGARVGSRARHHDAGREERTSNQVQAQGEPADENPSRRPCSQVSTFRLVYVGKVYLRKCPKK